MNIPPSTRIPVTLLTGFLGSGKTTLLNRLLKAPELSGAAVVVNEFGEVPIDHMLIEHSREELVLLSNGCLCCAVREDLITTLRELALRRKHGEVGPFRSLLIETTGLADPVPVVHSLMSNISLVTQYRFAGIITTVDAVNGISTLETHMEAVKQVAMADQIVLTKTELVTIERSEQLIDKLRRLNPAALSEQSNSLRLDRVLACLDAEYDPLSKADAVDNWLRSEAYERDSKGGGVYYSEHDATVRAFCIVRDEPLSWDVVSEWLDGLAATRGRDLLRVKGIVNVREASEKPIIVHAVQHLFHPPSVLDRWPTSERRSRFVFITRGMDEGTVENALHGLERGELARSSDLQQRYSAGGEA